MSKKMYTEEYIQDIANAIREKNLGIDMYTVSEMGNAIREIEVGCSKSQYIDNAFSVLKSIYNVLQTWKLFPDDNHYYGYVGSKFDFYISLLNFERGGISNYKIRTNNLAWGTKTNIIQSGGREVFYPIDSTDGQSINIFEVNYSDLPQLFNAISEFSAIDENAHPLFKDNFSNNETKSIKSIFDNAKLGDFYHYNPPQNPVAAYFFKNPADGKFYINIINSINNRYYYDTSNNVFYTGNAYYSASGPGTLYNTIPTFNLSYSAGVSPINIALSDLVPIMAFNSMDILDQNGNIVIPANCSLADLGLS